MDKLTSELFLEQANEKHHSKYIYNDLSFKSTHDKITITCPLHGDFKQEVRRHLQGCQCPKCAKTAPKTNEEIKQKLIAVYGDKYTYDNLNYKKRNEKVTVTCKKHGDFQMWSYAPFPTNPCPLCGSKAITTDTFIEKAKQVHGDEYDYSFTQYLSSIKKVDIICPKHGIFKQQPSAHLKGQGCPTCNASKLETQVELLLQTNNITYEKQKHFDWLGQLSLDFYLPEHNIAIECQGIQHFKPIKFYGGEKNFIIRLARDKKKEQLCNEHNVKLLYYADKDYNEKYNLITDEQTLIQQIMMPL